MNDFEKKIKSGLKKCPLHKFGADYFLVKDGWYECKKCHSYHKIEFNTDNEVKITPFKRGIIYNFR